MSTEAENLHRMSAPDPTVAGVSVGGETIFSDESGVFLIPAEHAPTLAEQGWATLPEQEAAPAKPARTRKPKAEASETAEGEAAE